MQLAIKIFFCCYDCYIAFKTMKQSVSCDWCGKVFTKKRSDIGRTSHNFCSPECCLSHRHKMGETSPGHCVNGEVVHRKIGRKLLPGEEVHHIDGNHFNNNPDNLSVLSKSAHAKIHALWKKRSKNGRFIETRTTA